MNADNERADLSTEFEDVKGRVKEAAGVLTDDEDLEESGRGDQAEASVKRVVDNVADTVKDGVSDVRDRLGGDR
jgi:uncharacterized protein YjbJ (UPF0337 family)